MPSPIRRVSFDRIARAYRWLEYATFFRALERCRFALLPEVAGSRRALVLGDGDGRFLVRLLAANPGLTADAVDGSAAMLRLAEGRVRALGPGALARARFHHADALAYAPEGTYDLVVTHFFLDCLSEPEITNLLQQTEPHLGAGARWLVSEFAIPGWQPAAMLARMLIGTLYRAFGLLTGLRTRRLPDFGTLLRGHGFALEIRRERLGGVLVSELWVSKR